MKSMWENGEKRKEISGKRKRKGNTGKIGGKMKIKEKTGKKW